MINPNPKPEPKPTDSKPVKPQHLMSGVEMFARFGEIGFIIAIPLAILLFAGAKLDQYLGTSPLWLFVGLGLSMLTTIWGIYKLIKSLNP